MSLALLSAGLLILPWVGVSGISLPVALVPLLAVSESYPAGRGGVRSMIGWSALVFGLWALVTTWWIWYAAPIGAIMSVIISVVLCGGVVTIYHWLSKRAPRSLAYTFLISAWISAELLYMNGQLSFPWLTLGNGLANDIPLVQWYDTTGVFGGSLWVLLMNVTFFEAFRRRSKAVAAAGLAVLAVPVIISLIIYTTYKETGRPVTVTAVQPNIEPYRERYILSQQEQNNIMLSLATGALQDARFVIFPETSIPETISENDLEADPTVRAFRRFIEERYPSTVFVVGASTRYFYMPGDKVSETARYMAGRDRFYDNFNTALALSAGQPAGIYHKAKLVVGAEATPYHKYLRNVTLFNIDLGGVSGQLGYGPERDVFTAADGTRAGPAICWEGVFGEYYGGFVRKGADIMLIISNDAWWSDTQGHRQLFRLARLRAVETRRAIARSANTGVSGFIDQRGRVLEKVGWDVRTAVTTQIVTNDRITFYTRYGDYVARISVLVFGLCILYYMAYRVRKCNLLT
ncbi:MAG: apolipoprotein N-acyltransferase [Rikenellaceae bacterium]|nr:apolipoprotein N-acyltransferase [Rikenellaceae bacterium]